MKGSNPLGYIISGLIALVFLGACIGLIADNTIGKQNIGNVTGATSTMLGLVPLIFIIGVVLAILSLAGLKVLGK